MVIKLKDGKVDTVFELRDMLFLIEEYMGYEARQWFDDFFSEADEDSEYIEDLEKDLQAAKNHHRKVMEQLREQSETIANLIREKDIDRKSLSTAAGIIGTVTWREMNV